jgi:polyvinyl alcohol dehydrogenase (cytochrome)
MKKLLTTTSLLACIVATATGPAALASDWPMFGQNINNTSAGMAETAITPKNAGTLKPKWIKATGGDVSARAAVVGGVVYFPDWGGNLWALDAATGSVVWRRQMSSYGLPAKTVARTSPAVVDGVLYIGSQAGASLLAIDAATGALKWMTQLETHPQAVITGSAAVAGGIVYMGVSSLEESAAAASSYPCCSFRGSIVAINAKTGKILWKTMTAPTGYTGAGVWGSNPVVDPGRKAIFIGTGDNYSKPTDPTYQACIAGGGTEPTCLSHDDHVDSMLSLDMATGKVKWAKRLINDDDWNVACFFGGPGIGNCPQGAGPDYDFGSAPNRFSITLPGASIPTTVIGAGQKSGIYSVFNADTGALVWAKRVGPGSFLGGIEWGSATDGRRIYVALSNFDNKRFQTGKAGAWSALDPATGNILWQVPDPNGANDLGPMAVAGGVVYAGSMGAAAGQSNMFALDAATGKTLWSFASGGSVISGATISGGVVYWGSGYANLGKGNTRFYAFSPGGQ